MQQQNEEKDQDRRHRHAPGPGRRAVRIGRCPHAAQEIDDRAACALQAGQGLRIAGISHCFSHRPKRPYSSTPAVLACCNRNAVALSTSPSSYNCWHRSAEDTPWAESRTKWQNSGSTHAWPMEAMIPGIITVSSIRPLSMPRRCCSPMRKPWPATSRNMAMARMEPPRPTRFARPSTNWRARSARCSCRPALPR